MGDLGHEMTENLLAALERRIAKVYKAASEDLKKKADEYFARFIDRDKEQQELLEAGKITEQQYKQWRLAQIGRGKRFLALRDDVAKRMLQANKVALSYVNDATPGIYSLNHNYAAYTIEQVSGNVGFTLYDEQTVKRLIAEDPTLLPKRRVDAPKDLKWNKKRFTAEITAGILQGEPIGKIADRVENLSDANRSGAIRNARTAVTGAQNAGRQESYNRAKEMGLQLRKRWIATKDFRTRHEHALLDGQTVALDEPFRVDGHKLMFPGDPAGVARLVWNCRCTMKTVEKEGIEAEPRQMRVRDPITGRNVVVNEMTYDEWLEWVKNRGE
jgi:SPP1 gp7 family putative phage head morphogenesis protein